MGKCRKYCQQILPQFNRIKTAAAAAAAAAAI